jgi:hypothetical protein
MSKSKDQTEDIPPSSSGENTGETVQPSLLSASTDNMQTFMQTTKPLSLSTSQNGQNALTTPDNSLTTPQISEKSRQHAMLVKVALKILSTAGLIKRYEVRSPDSVTVLKVRYEFDMSLWTESLELK